MPDIRSVVNHVYDISKHNLRNVVLYTTNRCNSKCKNCYIWKKQPKIDIPTKIVKKIILDNVTKKSIFKITGGEFLLHPEYKKILSLLNKYDCTYELFSNGILSDKLIRTIKQFKIKKLLISCDGVGKRYKQIRGVDGFKNVERVVDELKDKTDLTLNYTISPPNRKSDLKQVVAFADKKNVKLSIALFASVEYFDIDNINKTFETYDLDGISSNCFQTPRYLINKYIKMYNQWLKGNYKLPCLNIRSQVSIYPNGKVHLCECKNIILGDLNKESLGNIWNNKKTIEIQTINRNCNGCFLLGQRPIDIYINSTPLKFFIK